MTRGPEPLTHMDAPQPSQTIPRRADSRPLHASVIVPFHNAAATLPACLDALAAQDCDAPFEIVMVDNNSTDASAEIVEDFARRHSDLEVRLLSESTPGPAAARNTGVRAARSPLFLFTDADCIASPSWIQEMLAHFGERPDLGAVSGCIRPRVMGGGAIEKFTCLYTLPPHPRKEIHSRYTLLTGGFQTANLAVPKQVFDEVGGFDETLFPGEDHDLCRRIYERGRVILAAPDAVVYHWHRTTLRGMLRQAYGYGRSHGLALKRFVPGAFILCLPWIGCVCRRIGPGARLWIDLNQADKKTLILLALTALYMPLGIFLLLYLARLAWASRRRGRRLDVPLTLWETFLTPALMIAKAGALTWGRICGAAQWRVVCL